MLSKQIENAQKKVEEQNYLSRKRVLEYDDVMNEQRRVVYKYRREVLEGRDMGDVAREQIAGVVANKVDEYTASDVFEEWDLDGLETQLGTLWPVSVDLAELDPQTSSREQVTELLTEDALAAYDEREEEFGEELMRALERHILLQIIDTRWKEHLCRDGLHARGHPPPRVRPDRSPRRLQERGLHHVPGPDGLDLGGVRPADLPRRRRDRADARSRRRSRPEEARPTSTTPAAPRRASPPRSPRRARQPAPAAATATAAGRRRRGGRRTAAPATAAPTRRRSSRARTRRSAATTPAGAGRARSTRSATAPEQPVAVARITRLAATVRLTARRPRDPGRAAAGGPPTR